MTESSDVQGNKNKIIIVNAGFNPVFNEKSGTVCAYIPQSHTVSDFFIVLP